jgi:hypothetical protein
METVRMGNGRAAAWLRPSTEQRVPNGKNILQKRSRRSSVSPDWHTRGLRTCKAVRRPHDTIVAQRVWYPTSKATAAAPARIKRTSNTCGVPAQKYGDKDQRPAEGKAAAAARGSTPRSV